MKRWQLHAATAVVIATLSAATGCTGVDNPGPDDTAQALAAALSSGELSEVRFADAGTEPPQQWWNGVVEGMDGARLEVAVDQVTETSDDRATAALTYDWAISEREDAKWSYTTTLDMVRRSEEWAVRLSPAAVAPKLRQGEVLRQTATVAPRGAVLGAEGQRLVTERPVRRFGIDKTQVPAGRAADSAHELAALLGTDGGSLADRVRAAGEKAFVEAIVLRTEDVTPRIANGYGSIQGAVALADDVPLAPTKDFARPILGSVGEVTAEMIEESEGKYAVGDEAGVSGLQQRYDDQLDGERGVVVEAVDADTGQSRVLFRVKPEPGEPLRTSLDLPAQELAEGILADVRPASAIVAVRPSDGHVLAAASGPGGGGYSTATVGQYPPGSTFKVVTSLALLRSGMAPGTTGACPPTTVVDGKSFKNYDDYPTDQVGDITLLTAVANSCNTFFINERDQAPQRSLADAAADLGMGVDHDLGFPAYLGSVPAEAGSTEHAASMIGQGEVLASPLTMAAVAASVAAGHTVVPQLVLDTNAEAASQQSLTSGEANQLRGLMGAVVDQGSASFLGDVPGAPVLAKTGTAEFGTEEPLRTHAWMIAVHGDLAVAVFVDVGESGSSTAGPLLEQFLTGLR
jgi:cell division protein FtsI/penicillin-binding protein 2